MKRTYFSGLAFTLAMASGSSMAFGQAGYVPQPLYSGTGLAAPNYGQWAPPGPQQNFRLTGYQESVIPQAVPGQHQHVPLPPTNAQPMAPSYSQAPSYQQAPAPSYQPQPSYIQPTPDPSTYGDAYAGAPSGYSAAPTGSGCSTCGSNGYANYGVPNYTFGGGYGTGDCGYGTFGGTGLASRFGGFAGGCGGSTWFGGAGALFMNQQDGRNVRLSYDSNMPTPALLSTRDARIGTGPGVSTFVGKYICCGRNAIVGSYWGLFPSDSMTSIMPNPGENFRTSLPFTNLAPTGLPATLNGIAMPTQDVYTVYDGAQEHRLLRSQQVHNGELNLLGFGLGGASVGGPFSGAGGFGGGIGGGGFGGGAFGGGCGTGSCGTSACGTPACGSSCGSCSSCSGPFAGVTPGCCSKLRLGWLGGARWFRLQDSMEYASSETDRVFGGTIDDFYYRNKVTNDLVGFQLGGFGIYNATQRINLYAGTKFGVFGNHMKYTTYAGSDAQVAHITSSNIYNGTNYDFSSSRNDVAFLGEGDIGLNMRVYKCFSANVGYRAIGISGIANSVGQIPYRFDDVDSIRRINNNDSLLLHGWYLGGTYNF